jgi:hypothetical protein
MSFQPISCVDPDGEKHRIFTQYRGKPKWAIWAISDKGNWMVMKFSGSLNVIAKESTRLYNRNVQTKITEIKGI